MGLGPCGPREALRSAACAELPQGLELSGGRGRPVAARPGEQAAAPAGAWRGAAQITSETFGILWINKTETRLKLTESLRNETHLLSVPFAWHVLLASCPDPRRTDKMP